MKVYFESLGPFNEKGVSAVEFTAMRVPAAIEKLFYRGLSKGGAIKSTSISSVSNISSSDLEVERDDVGLSSDDLNDDLNPEDESTKKQKSVSDEVKLKIALQSKLVELSKSKN